jgi:hypothetical protein
MNIFANPRTPVTSRKYILAIQTLFGAISGLIKVSILLFYRRLGARVVSSTFRWVTWASICSIIAYTIVFLLMLCLGCRPFVAYWERDDITKLFSGDFKFHCIDEGALMVSASIISTVQDLITTTLPAFLYWNIRIPIRQKVLLFAIFAIGYGVSAIGALRAYYSWYVFYDTYDITWAIWDLLIVVMLEMHVGALCANAPILKAFWRSISGANAKSNSKNSKDSSNAGSSLGVRRTIMQRMGSRSTRGSEKENKLGYHAESSTTLGVHRSLGTDTVEGSHDMPPQSFAREELSTSSKCDVNSVSYDRYSEDIELGCSGLKDRHFGSSTHSLISNEEVIEALPAFPSSSLDPRKSNAAGSA